MKCKCREREVGAVRSAAAGNKVGHLPYPRQFVFVTPDLAGKRHVVAQTTGELRAIPNGLHPSDQRINGGQQVQEASRGAREAAH